MFHIGFIPNWISSSTGYYTAISHVFDYMDVLSLCIEVGAVRVSSSLGPILDSAGWRTTIEYII